ncbi:GHKL domain-containing protein [Listeria booriae]|uniref:GHKL domain-containing protein n=1 Tax=Listeria booriae TaxID=1552123 RepID=UPI001626B09B|nr:GHKL domain-containing protein [Listeria booriae]MBC2323954.1 GHKL domain-containing protein [Listeria booriae]MCD2207227.1 GHKL domain-containing protein [Listeria booriae]
MRLILTVLILAYTIACLYLETHVVLQVASVGLCFGALALAMKIRAVKLWLAGITIIGSLLALIYDASLAGWALLFLFLVAQYQLGQLEQTNQQLTSKSDHLQTFVALLQKERHKNYASHANDAAFQLAKNERPDIAAWLVTTDEQLKLANLTFKTDLHSAISDLPFQEDELLALLTAIMTNAKQAASQVENGWISLRLQLQSGLFLLEISNASNMPNQAVMDNLFARPKPTSGTAIIKHYITKAHGIIDYRFDQAQFKLLLKIPAIKK